ncbi:Flp pilus assembly protein, ATPase CpaE [Yersinia frederiksenii ATCC 33641]|nr:Flp pilus assembly protein, ATPase CpaE [Yersinia frederiksenii ATCC 33641]
MDEVSSQLVLKNVSNIQRITDNFLKIESLDLSSTIHTVIIDIENATNTQKITNKINTILLNTASCLVVGDSDSIVLSQQFVQAGVDYLHYPSQLTDIVARVKSTRLELSNKRSAIKISVLGCKGGIGTSTISYHLAQRIAVNNRVPVLLVQGHGGSQDIDIISDHILDNDVTEVTDYLSIKKNGGEITSNFYDPLLERYNFSIFDYPVFNLDKEKIEHILNFSDCVIFIISHDLASLRVAKLSQEVNRFLQTVGNGVKREFTCLNQIKPAGGAILSLGDLTALLNNEISAQIIYQRPPNDPSKPLRLQGKPAESLTVLAQKVLGQNPTSRKYTSHLSGLMQRYLKK